jgi:hypothetical protein
MKVLTGLKGYKEYSLEKKAIIQQAFKDREIN